MTISINRVRQAQPQQNYERRPSPGPAGGPRRVHMPSGASIQAQTLAQLQQQISLMSRVVLDLRGQVKQLMAMAGVQPAPQPQHHARPPPAPAGGNRPPPQQPSRPQAQPVPASEQIVEAEVAYERGSDEDMAAMRYAANGFRSPEEIWSGGEED